MTYRELCAIKKAIASKREKLEQLRSKAYHTAAKLDSNTRRTGTGDRVGGTAGNIVDLEGELAELNAAYAAALKGLSIECYTANCIYLRIACGWKWDKIADTVHDNKDAIRKACSRYEWH